MGALIGACHCLRCDVYSYRRIRTAGTASYVLIQKVYCSSNYSIPN